MTRLARPAAQALGELLVTAGLVVLLFAAYELWGTGAVTAAAQDRLRDELANSWAGPADRPAGPPDPATPPQDLALGDGVALLRIPRFGPNWSRVVVEGVTVPALRTGPGHVPGSALPGQVGNLVVSGHRTTYGAPFRRLDVLKPGDEVTVETRTEVATYAVTGTRIVAPSAVEVTYPVPGQRGAVPTEALLTLTTCHPEFSARQRMVVRAELVTDRPK